MTAIVLDKRPDNTSKILSLSVSKCKTFKECPKKFHFSYILKLPQKEMDFHTFGKFLHEILEKFHKEIINGNPDPDVQIMGKVFKECYGIWRDKLTQEQFNESKSILANYLKRLNEQGENRPKVISAEDHFYVLINDEILLNGFIDRTQIDSDGTINVTDYKTSKSDKYLRNDFFQLLTYAYVMCLLDPELQKVRVSYLMLRLDCKSLTKEFTREEIMKSESQFIKYFEEISAEKLFRPKTSPLCKYCSFLEHCEAGQSFVGIDPKSGTVKIGESSW